MDENIDQLLAEMQMPGERPIPAPRWRRHIPAPRDVPSPDTAGMDAYIEEILSQMPGERTIPAPRRRRPIPAPRDMPSPDTVGMDAYIEEILSHMPGERPIQAQRRRRPIRDEPIPETVKRRLLKPLQPVKYRPPRPSPKDRKRKAIEEEFYPIPRQKSFRSVGEYQDEILDLFTVPKEHKLVFRQTPWVIGSFLRGWQMDVPQGHPHGVDPRAFLEGVQPQIRAKLEKEIKALNGIKFQLALKVQLRKDNPDGSEEYTNPVLRHEQEAILQNSEIKGALNQAFPTIQETLEKWTQRGSCWVVDRVEVLWLDIARYQPLRGESYIPLPAALKQKKAVVNVKNKDNHCLRWALRSALFPVAHGQHAYIHCRAV